MTRFNNGFILLDTIIALLLLSLTLTSVYGLLIKSIQYQNRLVSEVLFMFDRGQEYYEYLQEIIEG